MHVFNSSVKARSFLKKGAALTIGNYDGLHQGHRLIFQNLKKEAGKRHLPAVVYTFKPHPVKFLAPKVAPPLINTHEQKIELLKECGIDAVIFEPFTASFSRQSADTFFKKILMDRLNARFIIVGYDFTFGRKREGNIETLEILCFKSGIDVSIVKPCMLDNTLVSSTLIRNYIQEGKVHEAGRLLKRSFFIDGKIVKGKQRGARLGIHTANLKTKNELIPKDGVYVTQSRVDHKIYGSVTNIGMNPTFDNQFRTIETHIFNFQKKIYNKSIRLFFVNRLRDEKKFKSPTELARQIQKDIIKAQKILRH